MDLQERLLVASSFIDHGDSRLFRLIDQHLLILRVRTVQQSHDGVLIVGDLRTIVRLKTAYRVPRWFAITNVSVRHS